MLSLSMKTICILCIIIQICIIIVYNWNDLFIYKETIIALLTHSPESPHNNKSLNSMKYGRKNMFM